MIILPAFPPTPPQVLAAILREAKLPGWTVDNGDSFANVKASALVRMDEQLTVFAVSGTAGADMSGQNRARHGVAQHSAAQHIMGQATADVTMAEPGAVVVAPWVARSHPCRPPLPPRRM